MLMMMKPAPASRSLRRLLLLDKAVGPTRGNARYLILVVSLSGWTVLLSTYCYYYKYTTATSLISLLIILWQLKIKKGLKEATQLG
jgi:hypothetical protein